MSDQLKAAIIAFVNSLFPFLVLIGAVNWSADTISAFMLVVSNFMTTVGLIWAVKKPAPPAPVPGDV